MKTFYLPFALAVGGSLLYHLSQKSIPKDMNPLFATIIAYLVGIVLCTICAFIYPSNKSFVNSVKESNWAVFAVGAAIVGIELGILLAYRAGWRISVAAVATNAAVTAMLIPIGILIFKEQLSVRNVIGVLLCIAGLILVVRD
jgi:uncharacterized membrane protein